MINKLYPPYIEGNLPAFSTIGEEVVLQLQYVLNRGVNYQDIDKYSLKVKKVTTNQVIGTIQSEPTMQGIAEFNLTELNLIEGQYYKFQLAFVDENGVEGYYSTPGVARYIKKPIIESLEFDYETLKGSGIYNSNGSNEYVYSYWFKIYKLDGELIENSSEIIFNSSNLIDDNKAMLNYSFTQELNYNQIYYLELQIKTGNNYTITSISEPIQIFPSIMPTEILNLEAINNYDNGYIKINISNTGTPISGYFKIGRSSSKDNFKSYEEILNFELVNEVPNKTIYKDYYIEHGVEYRYAYQQYNIAYKDKEDGAIISRRIWSNQEKAKFEDLFLSDGETQFKIKYNPKVSSIKTTLQETKVDTLGGQYPFIFRNGNVKYHEFPISGLISYLEDEEEIFMERPLDFSPTTNLTDENIQIERQFKFKVMDWLNNGEIKYFKSPTEGSYLIRLMNISLTPNDTLGRMLHSFSATAYEVGSINKTNLEKYKFIYPEKFIPTDNTTIIGQIDKSTGEYLNLVEVQEIQLLVNQSDRIIGINSESQQSLEAGTTIKINDSINIFIPIYIKNFRLDEPYRNLKIEIISQTIIENGEIVENSNSKVGIIYKIKNQNLPYSENFEKIDSINKDIVPALQIRQLQGHEETLNVKEYLENEILNDTTKHQISYFSFLHFYKNPEFLEQNKFMIKINNSSIDLNLIGSYQLNNIDYITSLEIDPGVVLECGYYLNYINMKEGSN